MESRSEVFVSTDGRAALEEATVIMGGREFTASGAFVSDDRCAGYLKRDAAGNAILTTWEGQRIGRARIVSERSRRRSYVSSSMYQVQVTLDVSGVTYTGRCAGFEMLFQGKRVKGQ
jgi:hypothetical protein